MHQAEDTIPIPDDIFAIDDYSVLCLLSDQSAGQSKVFLVVKEGQQLAVKVHEKMRYFKDQVVFLEQLDSPYVVKMVKYSDSACLHRKNKSVQKWPCIFLEFASRGDLSQYWKIAKRFSPQVCKTLFKQMLLAIQHIHEKGITHRDLKLQNFVFDHNFIIKVVDFGFSTYSQGPQGNFVLKEKKGTYMYWAPEVHRNHHNGLNRDIYAVMIIMFLIYTGYPPFINTLPQTEKYRLLKDGNPQECKKYWQKMKNRAPPPQLQAIFERSFNQDPSRRYSLNDLLTHPWLNTNFATEQEVKIEVKKIYQKLKERDQRVEDIQSIIKNFQQKINEREKIECSRMRGLEEDFGIIPNLVKKYNQFINLGVTQKVFQKTMPKFTDSVLSNEFSPAFVLAWLFSLVKFDSAWLKDVIELKEEQGVLGEVEERVQEEKGGNNEQKQKKKKNPENQKNALEQQDIFYDIKLCQKLAEYDVKNNSINLLFNFDVDEQFESINMEGRLYENMLVPDRWGISWHVTSGNQFWANSILNKLQHELNLLTTS